MPRIDSKPVRKPSRFSVSRRCDSRLGESCNRSPAFRRGSTRSICDDDDDPAARGRAFSAAELRSSAEATTRGRAGSDDSDAERATRAVAPVGCRQSRAAPSAVRTDARGARYFDAAGSPMRARATTYGSIAVDVADAGDDEEEEDEEGDRARDAAGARSSGWLGTSARPRGATVAAAACLAMCGVGALALAIAPPEIRAGVASSLGLRIPESPKPGFVEANRHESATPFLAPLGSNDANEDGTTRPTDRSERRRRRRRRSNRGATATWWA